MLGPTISDPTVGTGSRKPALCGHHQLCRIGIERLRDQRLADAGAIGVGSVDKGNPPIHDAPEEREASLSSLGGPHTPGPVMRIAPKPICPTGNRARVIWADTFDLLFREFAIGPDCHSNTATQIMTASAKKLSGGRATGTTGTRVVAME